MGALDVSRVVGVVGAGAMGAGIAHVAALAGHRVRLYDVAPDAIARGRAGIEKDLNFLVGKGRLAAAEAAAVLTRVEPADTLAAFADCGLVIEAAAEDLSIKQQLFATLEGIVPDDCVLATNTSSLSITAIAATLARPQRLAGMHFFNPAPRMKLVEIVSGVETDAAVTDLLAATARAWGKVTVHARSTPGFIVNRLARPFYGEAWRVLLESGGDPASLDAVMRDCGGFPMGPFELMDLIGHDVNLAVTRSVFEATFFDRRYTPSLAQQELVRAGRLGRKRGRGIYDYRDGAQPPAPRVDAGAEAARRVCWSARSAWPRRSSRGWRQPASTWYGCRARPVHRAGWRSAVLG
ncbi:MAG: 3-hydroxyacyl-CoA dehydrogenase NAD-binding domain-containing protein [Betaproteobacteria bacterium]